MAENQTRPEYFVISTVLHEPSPAARPSVHKPFLPAKFYAPPFDPHLTRGSAMLDPLPPRPPSPTVPPFTHNPTVAAFHVPSSHLLSTLQGVDKIAVGAYIFSPPYPDPPSPAPSSGLSTSSAPSSVASSTSGPTDASPSTTRQTESEKEEAPRLLLLRRAPTDTHALTYEPPGGGVDATDETLLHALAREVQEETGLVVRHVAGLVGTKDFVSSRGWKIRKFSFFVEAGEGDETAEGTGFTETPTPGRNAGNEATGAERSAEKRGGDVRGYAGAEGRYRVKGYGTEYGPRVRVNPEEHCEWGWYLRSDIPGLEMTGTAGEVEVESAFDKWRAGEEVGEVVRG